MKKLTNYALTAAGPLILAAMIITVTAPGAMAQARPQPALVRDADNPARHAFAYSSGHSWIGNAPNASFSLTVPAGKRLVIEQLAFFASVTASAKQKVSAEVQTTVNNVVTTYDVMGATNGSSGPFDHFIGAAQMRSYADAQSAVEILVTRADTSGGTFDDAFVSVSGYLVDLP